jgi:hypothetical protein
VRAIAFVPYNWSVEELFCTIVLHLIIISVLNSIAVTLSWSLVDRFIKSQRLSSPVSSTTRIPALIPSSLTHYLQMSVENDLALILVT